MRAIIVCVDYSNILALTLHYNHHHFEEIHVVTSDRDHKTQILCRDLKLSGQVPNLQHHETNLFYRDGALFNKYRALEWGLDLIGRHGWLAIMDADVALPKVLPTDNKTLIIPGNLYTPLRRMAPLLTAIPPEPQWEEYPHHKLHVTQPYHFSGYLHIFHADDPFLKKAPWHSLDWAHAGGGDTEFQNKWPRTSRIRPKWEVLHLGEPCTNWAGVGNKGKLREMLLRRKTNDLLHWGAKIKIT